MTTTTQQPLPANQVNVKVFNGSGVAGAAGRLSRSLSGDGYVLLSPANAPERYDRSTVYFVEQEYFANARQIAQIIGLTDAVQSLPDPAPVAYETANVIVIIGRDELVDSPAVVASTTVAPTTTTLPTTSTTSITTTTSTTTTTTTTPSDRGWTPAQTIPISENGDPVDIEPPTYEDDEGPPLPPAIDLGVLDELQDLNISVVIEEDNVENGEVVYQVNEGDELTIAVFSRVGTGSVRITGYNLTERVTLLLGAVFSFPADQRGLFDVFFTPDGGGILGDDILGGGSSNAGRERAIFQLEIS